MGRRSREKSTRSRDDSKGSRDKSKRSGEKTKRSRKKEVSEIESRDPDASGELEPDPPQGFPVYETFQLVNALFASIFIGLVFFGASSNWSTKTLGVLFSANIIHLVLSILLGIYVSFRAERSKVLYGVGMFVTISTLALSSGVFIFLSEV